MSLLQTLLHNKPPAIQRRNLIRDEPVIGSGMSEINRTLQPQGDLQSEYHCYKHCYTTNRLPYNAETSSHKWESAPVCPKFSSDYFNQSIKHRLWLVFLRNRLRESCIPIDFAFSKFFVRNKSDTT